MSPASFVQKGELDDPLTVAEITQRGEISKSAVRNIFSAGVLERVKGTGRELIVPVLLIVGGRGPVKKPPTQLRTSNSFSIAFFQHSLKPLIGISTFG